MANPVPYHCMETLTYFSFPRIYNTDYIFNPTVQSIYLFTFFFAVQNNNSLHIPVNIQIDINIPVQWNP